jgi:hypothetical protein
MGRDGQLDIIDSETCSTFSAHHIFLLSFELIIHGITVLAADQVFIVRMPDQSVTFDQPPQSIPEQVLHVFNRLAQIKPGDISIVGVILWFCPVAGQHQFQVGNGGGIGQTDQPGEFLGCQFGFQHGYASRRTSRPLTKE